MVESTIRTVDTNASVRLVHASRGKITRAEPVSALFEQRRAHFIGTFPELEDELCSFSPGSSDSPDRLDAMVWAFTELMVGVQAPAIPICMPFYSGVPSFGGSTGSISSGTDAWSNSTRFS
jgi:phage terminase large subunit-like protein